MALAGKIEERGVESRGVLRLIKRDRNIELQASLCFVQPIVEFRVAFRVQAVCCLEQLDSQFLAVIRPRLCRREPVPQLALLRFEIVPEREMIRQWLQN